MGTGHLDRFLASLERFNAETEHRLSDKYQSRNDIEGEKLDNQKVNLRWSDPVWKIPKLVLHFFKGVPNVGKGMFAVQSWIRAIYSAAKRITSGC